MTDSEILSLVGQSVYIEPCNPMHDPMLGRLLSYDPDSEEMRVMFEGNTWSGFAYDCDDISPE